MKLQRKVCTQILRALCHGLCLISSSSVDPGFYVPNWLYLGKCHMQLGHKEEAREWLKKAADHQGDVPDDKEV